jgi:hypothetical protein
MLVAKHPLSVLQVAQVSLLCFSDVCELFLLLQGMKLTSVTKTDPFNVHSLSFVHLPAIVLLNLMSIRPTDQNKQAEAILARTDAILNEQPKHSNVAVFEPLNISDAKKIGKVQQPQTTSNTRQENRLFKETDNKSSTAGAPGPRRRNLDEVRSLRSDVGGDNAGLADNFSDIPEGVDLGTNVFITYFLHAVEVERLILINKEQLEEAIEMEKEIETLQNQTDSLKVQNKEKQDEVSSLKSVVLLTREQGEKTASSLRLEMQSLLEREKAIQSKLLSQITADEANREQEISRRLVQEMAKRTEKSENTDAQATLKEVVKRHESELSQLKLSSEDRLRREQELLQKRLSAQFSIDLEKTKRELLDAFNQERMKLLTEQNSSHQQQLRELEIRQKSLFEKEKLALMSKISELNEELEAAKARPQTPQKLNNVVPQLASPRSEAMPRRDVLASPPSNIGSGQKLQNSKFYQPLMVKSKLREQSREFSTSQSQRLGPRNPSLPRVSACLSFFA